MLSKGYVWYTRYRYKRTYEQTAMIPGLSPLNGPVPTSGDGTQLPDVLLAEKKRTYQSSDAGTGPLKCIRCNCSGQNRSCYTEPIHATN